jgi:5-methylcytosine-specific restriction endonuclease McrA
VRAAVFKADQGRCQVPWCRAPARDVHHIVKRSQAPRLKYDPANLVSLCRACHAQTDAPYVRGRLVLTPLGDKRVLYQVITAPDKAGARGLMALYLSAGGR